MITQIEIQNFKCFEKEKFSFKSLNLLTGINGMGKSTLVQTLLLLNESYLKTRLKGLLLDTDLIKIGYATNAYCDYTNKDNKLISYTIQFEKEKLKFDFQVDKSRPINYLPRKNTKNDTSLLEKISSYSLFNNNLKYLNAERVSPSTLFKMSDYSVRELHQLGTHGEYTAHFLAMYGDFPIKNKALFSTKKGLNSLKELTEFWMSEVRPGFKIRKLTISETGFVEMKYSFSKGGVKDTSDYTAPNVGFGITYTLPVIVMLLSAVPGDLLVIENPEAHLHPRGQSRLGDLMCQVSKTGVQLLVETHSDHILNGIRVSVMEKNIEPDSIQIFYFTDSETKKGPEILIPKIEPNGQLLWSKELGYDWPNGFFDEWDNNLEKLLIGARR